MKVNEAVESSLQLENSNLSFEHSFEISLAMTGEPEKINFRIYHSIRGDLLGDQMREWAHKERLVPWVAVASPVCHPMTQHNVYDYCTKTSLD